MNTAAPASVEPDATPATAAERAASGPSVKAEAAGFEGPFDLLLHLILNDKVDLYEVSLSDIVDAYLAEVVKLKNCDLEVATEFLLIASTLIDLKVRRLLPEDEALDLDEELALWEERDMLLSRLLESKTFKDAAQALERMADSAALIRPRIAGLEDHFLALAPDLLENSTPEDVHKAFMKAMRPKPVTNVGLHHVTAVKASVTKAIHEMLLSLPNGGRLTFRQLTDHVADDVMEVVVRFLAVLELFKQGFVDIDQVGHFGDLTVEWVGSEQDRDAALTGIDTYEG
ncbi:MAG: segregation/condensation protein A [Acidimicrobiales bacterium]|nr:segregation/condensation protein A [Acidimicrobiales bacterium]